jgi:hypothetical protein
MGGRKPGRGVSVSDLLGPQRVQPPQPPTPPAQQDPSQSADPAAEQTAEQGRPESAAAPVGTRRRQPVPTARGEDRTRGTVRIPWELDDEFTIRTRGFRQHLGFSPSKQQVMVALIKLMLRNEMLERQVLDELHAEGSARRKKEDQSGPDQR